MAEQNLEHHYKNPYLFNAKELDRETGLYYYGARYYNPKLSIWYGVDPLAVYNPVMETEFYGDGQHNGGVFYWGNLNPYMYTYDNPIVYIDPNGKQTLSPALGRTIPRLGPIEIPGSFAIPRIPILPNAELIRPLYPTAPNAPKISKAVDFDWSSIDMGNVKSWPKPPTDSKLTPGDPSRGKPKQRGEKSLYDEKGGEWRPHKPDKYHPEGHWDYKPNGNNQGWQDIYPNFVVPDDASLIDRIRIKYQEWKHKRNLKNYQNQMKQYEQQKKEYIKNYGA